MGKQFAKIESEHKAFIERQKIFFVASAPPKGRSTFHPRGCRHSGCSVTMTSPTLIARAAAARHVPT